MISQHLFYGIQSILILKSDRIIMITDPIEYRLSLCILRQQRYVHLDSYSTVQVWKLHHKHSCWALAKVLRRFDRLAICHQN